MKNTCVILTLCGLLWLVGCAQYDAEQAERNDPPGDPPALTLTVPGQAYEDSSFTVRLRIVPGTYPVDHWQATATGGQTLPLELVRNTATLIELEAEAIFADTGRYWIYATVWDNHSGKDADSASIRIVP